MKSIWSIFIGLVMLFLVIMHSECNIPEEKINNLPTLNVETLCNNTNVVTEIFLQRWSATNFQFGKLRNSYRRNKIHKCTIKIKTQENFGLAAAIEGMNIGDIGKQDWDCPDYIQFKSYGKSFLEKVFGRLDVNILSVNSEKLCGQKSLKGYLTRYSQIRDITKEANSFNTDRNTLDLVFHQDADPPAFNNSFSIIITTIGLGSGHGHCGGMYKCRKDPITCISPDFLCDGHVNCALPSSGSDEIGCETDIESSFYNPIAITMIALSGVVAAIIGICILVTVICQLRKKALPGNREDYRQRQRDEVCSAMGSAAPRYESVVLEDAETSKVTLDGDLPPSYDALFPKEDPSEKIS